MGRVRTGDLDTARNALAELLGVVVFVEAEAEHPRLKREAFPLDYCMRITNQDEGQRTAPENIWKKGLSAW